MAGEDERQKAADEAAAAAKEADEAKAAAAAKETEDEGEFDKDRALATIKKQRESETAAKKRAQELEAKVKEYEDRDKSETEKLTDAKEQAAKDAADAKSEVIRLRMAIKYGLDEEDLDLLGTGDEEAIEKRAKRLADRTASSKDDAPRRPRERLKTGATSATEPDENDPKKLAAQVSRGW